MRAVIVLSLAALAAAPAASADRTKDVEALAHATAGRTAGAPVDCVWRGRTDDFQVAGRYLIFRVSPRLTYVNEVGLGCTVGQPRAALVFRSTSSRMCEGEIAQAVDPLGGATGGGCALGKFVPYERK